MLPIKSRMIPKIPSVLWKFSFYCLAESEMKKATWENSLRQKSEFAYHNTSEKKIRGEITREMKKQISCVWFRNQYQGGFENISVKYVEYKWKFPILFAIFFLPVINRYSNDFHGTSGMTSSLKSCNSLKEFKINIERRERNRDRGVCLRPIAFQCYSLDVLIQMPASKRDSSAVNDFMFSLFSSSIEFREKISSKFDNFSLRTGLIEKPTLICFRHWLQVISGPVKLLLMIAENSKSWAFLIDNW